MIETGHQSSMKNQWGGLKRQTCASEYLKITLCVNDEDNSDIRNLLFMLV